VTIKTNNCWRFFGVYWFIGSPVHWFISSLVGALGELLRAVNSPGHSFA